MTKKEIRIATKEAMEKQYYDKCKKEDRRRLSMLSYDDEVQKVIRARIGYYYYLNNVSKEENKVTYLITITDYEPLKVKSKFITALRGKTKRKLSGFDFYYVIEPDSEYDKAHIHIKLVIDKGYYKVIKETLEKHTDRYFNIKRQRVTDDSYLIKELKLHKYKAYVGWLAKNKLTIKKAVGHSRDVSFEDGKSVAFKEYRQTYAKIKRLLPK
jgi:hypothetical protein